MLHPYLSGTVLNPRLQKYRRDLFPDLFENLSYSNFKENFDLIKIRLVNEGKYIYRSYFESRYLAPICLGTF